MCSEPAQLDLKKRIKCLTLQQDVFWMLVLAAGRTKASEPDVLVVFCPSLCLCRVCTDDDCKVKPARPLPPLSCPLLEENKKK